MATTRSKTRRTRPGSHFARTSRARPRPSSPATAKSAGWPLTRPGRFTNYLIEARIAGIVTDDECQPRSHPEPPAWLRTTAEPGYQLCPSCRGRGWCHWCHATGHLLLAAGLSCDACAGKGECPVCEGDGQLLTDHHAFTDWKDENGST